MAGWPTINDMTFKAIYDDGLQLKWHDPLVDPEGNPVMREIFNDGQPTGEFVQALTSVDDIDRTKCAHFLTYNGDNEVINVQTFTPEERLTRHVVWRMTRNLLDSAPLYCLCGYVEQIDEDSVDAQLYRAYPDGTNEPAEADDYNMVYRDVELF